MKSTKKAKTLAEMKKAELIESIKSVNRSIQTARAVFDSTPDEELLESCMYEIKYLQSRYAFLIKEARALDIEDLHVLREPGRRQT